VEKLGVAITKIDPVLSRSPFELTPTPRGPKSAEDQTKS